jgi:hypothetical protein
MQDICSYIPEKETMSVGYTVLQFSVVTSYTTQALKVPGV